MPEDKTVIPNGKKWEFDEDVTAVFDDMLSRSIPDYQGMRNFCEAIGANFITPETEIVDIGCSLGRAVEGLVSRFSETNTFALYDVSEPMLARCRRRYETLIEQGRVKVENYDLRQGLKNTNCSLVLSILTLQFTPLEYRHKIVQSIYNALNNGGAFIFVEKVLGNTSTLDSVLVKEYYKLKSSNLYTQEQIESKRKSLEGVLVPLTVAWNEDLLRHTGFRQIDCFWRQLNFAAWIAIK